MKFKENIQLGQPLLFLFSTLHGTRITKISTLFSGQNLLWCILHGRSPKINPVDSKCDLKCVRVKTAPQTISSCLETLNLLDNVLQFPSECDLTVRVHLKVNAAQLNSCNVTAQWSVCSHEDHPTQAKERMKNCSLACHTVAVNGLELLSQTINWRLTLLTNSLVWMHKLLEGTFNGHQLYFYLIEHQLCWGIY